MQIKVVVLDMMTEHENIVEGFFYFLCAVCTTITKKHELTDQRGYISDVFLTFLRSISAQCFRHYPFMQ